MKRILRSAGALLVCSALFTPAAHAYLTVVGNNATAATAAPVANGTTFNTAPNNAIFYKPTGDYFFGLSADATAAGTYAVCYGNYRNTPDVAPTLTPLATQAVAATSLNQLNIDKMAIVPYSTAITSPTIVAAAGTFNAVTTINAITKTYLTSVQPGTVNGIAGIGDTTPGLTTGIRAMATGQGETTAGSDMVFMATAPAGVATTVPFGSAGGVGAATFGINAALIGRNTTTGAPTFTSVGANGTANSNTSTPVDLTFTGSFLCATVVAGAQNNTAPTGASPALWYDEQLQTLYVGIRAQVAASGAATVPAGLYGINAYRVTKGTTALTVGAAAAPYAMYHVTMNNAVSAGATPFAPIALAAAPAGGNWIIGASQINATSAANVYSFIYKLRTMHTSTGQAYLIINGGSGANASSVANAAGMGIASNQIWAVPLVNGTIPAGETSTTATIGCFASALSAGHTVRAGAAGATDLVPSTSPAAMVGGFGLAPTMSYPPSSLTINNAGNNIVNVTDMYVDGDAVYVACGTTATAANLFIENGLFKSQAVFNEFGQIDHWTQWQKVVPNNMGGNAAVSAAGTAPTGFDGQIDFAAVDGYTGHIWVTNKNSLKSKVTQWTVPTTLTNVSGLAAAVNAALPSGLCYSMLDLNTSSTGWGATTFGSTTLFGGQEKVCFAITGSLSFPLATAPALGFAGTYTSLNAPLLDTAYDFTNSATFVTTTLPAGAGAVVALGFSGWNPDKAGVANGITGTTGFFLAGCAGTASTAPGLYALPAFNPDLITNSGLLYLSSIALPLSTATWTRITTVSGIPVKIASLGGGLHVLTRTATIDRVYSCQKVNSIANMITSFTVTASSGSAPSGTNSSLAAVSQIYDLVVSVSAQAAVTDAILSPQGTEQLMILTNDGIYTTTCATGTQGSGTPVAAGVSAGYMNQLNFGWTRINTPTTNGLFTDYLGQPNYNRGPQTFWYGNWAVNPSVSSVYNQYIWYQVSHASLLVATAGNTGATNGTGTTIYANPSVTATYNGAISFGQTAAPSIYATFPVNYRLLYDDGCRRYFVQKNPSDDGAYQILVLPYNLYAYNITTNGKAVQSDAALAATGTFYWMSTAGDTGQLLAGTSKGIISLQ